MRCDKRQEGFNTMKWALKIFLHIVTFHLYNCIYSLKQSCEQIISLFYLSCAQLIWYRKVYQLETVPEPNYRYPKSSRSMGKMGFCHSVVSSNILLLRSYLLKFFFFSFGWVAYFTGFPNTAIICSMARPAEIRFAR